MVNRRVFFSPLSTSTILLLLNFTQLKGAFVCVCVCKHLVLSQLQRDRPSGPVNAVSLSVCESSRSLVSPWRLIGSICRHRQWSLSNFSARLSLPLLRLIEAQPCAASDPQHMMCACVIVLNSSFHMNTHIFRKRTHCKSCWRSCLTCWLWAIVAQTLINYSIITDIATVIVWILNK